MVQVVVVVAVVVVVVVWRGECIFENLNELVAQSSKVRTAFPK